MKRILAVLLLCSLVSFPVVDNQVSVQKAEHVATSTETITTNTPDIPPPTGPGDVG